MTSQPDSVASGLPARISAAIAEAGGWLPFDRFMALALYEPDLGYYSSARRKFGLMPASGSDFVTAPELSPLFGRALAVQVADALAASGTRQVYEFGAGSGALAEQLLQALDERGLAVAYAIIDLSGTLQARQAERLARFNDRVQWLARWPDKMHGVVVANELLDAIPVQLLHFDGHDWFERGVVTQGDTLAFADRPTDLRPPLDAPFVPGTVTEIHPQAEAFVRTLAQHLQRGAAFFIDYGFPEAEYYLPQRVGGTLMCHHLHQADGDPLQRVGEKDITAHVNFTGIALAAQDAGLAVVGYTSQARFLLNCGLAPMIEGADLRERAMAQKLITEHEMGELFKVLALASADLAHWVPCGCAEGDRMHRL
ncbi:SAM-dependent methyltransferase [Ideonella sp. 4Y11]|uniref:SAM-dependent methyltransferase n=1 Tax=Ideonella aquatica TaxID=2824119 RepID=A0A941BND7_9BURK|nr:SAM-dependent methyltransferase [Ideonella aquatica]MBQ0961874.1 SAM-dependent methyltransferase [Ideonella aquatica]